MGKVLIIKGADFSTYKIGDADIDVDGRVLTQMTSLEKAYLPSDNSGIVSFGNYDFGRILIYKVTPGEAYVLHGKTPGGSYGGLGFTDNISDIAIGGIMKSIDNNAKDIAWEATYDFTVPEDCNYVIVNDAYHDNPNMNPYITK